jgi:hypothetical protein
MTSDKNVITTDWHRSVLVRTSFAIPVNVLETILASPSGAVT